MPRFNRKKIVYLAVSAGLFMTSGVQAAQNDQGFVDAMQRQISTFSKFSGSSDLLLTTREGGDVLRQNPEKLRLVAFNESLPTYKFSGEDSLVRFTFEHNLQKSGTVAEVVLAYKNAVSVMPEASYVTANVNGRSIGQFEINSPSGFKSEKLVIPPSALIDGTNVIELRAIQRHRVDCSLDATYELWTEIDHLNSGIVLQKNRALNDFNALKTIPRMENGLTDLRLVLPNESDIEAVNRALPLVQTMALALGRDDISVSVANHPGVGPGIDLYLVTQDKNLAVNLATNKIANQVDRGLFVAESNIADRASVILKAPTSEQVSGQLLHAVQSVLKPLIQKSVGEDHHGEISAEAGSTHTLAEAGYKSTAFSGRLFRTDFELNLPGDFYPADYATIDLGLHAATSPGLKPQSQLLVRVNGNIVKSLPMRDTDGQVFENRRVELPMRAFRPGKNHVEILAEVEKASDELCIYSERDEATPRFILLETTEVRVPHLARISRLPELSVLAETAYPYNAQPNLNIYAAHSDSRTLSAALTVLTKLGMAAKSPVNAKIILGRPDVSDVEDKLVIAPRTAYIQSQHNSSDQVGSVSTSIMFHNADWLPDLTTTASIGQLPMPEVVEATPEDLLAAFRQKTKDSATGLSKVGVIRQKFENIYSEFMSWLRYQPGKDIEPTASVANRHANFVQTVDGKNNSVATWLTADTSEDVVRASMILADPQNWAKVHGSDVKIDLRNKRLKTVASGAYGYRAISNYKPSNLRRIAAAWFSDNFIVYVVLVIGFMALFATWVARSIATDSSRPDLEG